MRAGQEEKKHQEGAYMSVTTYHQELATSYHCTSIHENLSDFSPKDTTMDLTCAFCSLFVFTPTLLFIVGPFPSTTPAFQLMNCQTYLVQVIKSMVMVKSMVMRWLSGKQIRHGPQDLQTMDFLRKQTFVQTKQTWCESNINAINTVFLSWFPDSALTFSSKSIMSPKVVFFIPVCTISFRF